MLKFALAFVLAIAFAPSSEACRVVRQGSALFYEGLPDTLHEGAVVLDLEMLETYDLEIDDLPTRVRARVHNVLRGVYFGDEVDIGLSVTSCDQPPIRPGVRGVMVGAFGVWRDGGTAFIPMRARELSSWDSRETWRD